MRIRFVTGVLFIIAGSTAASAQGTDDSVERGLVLRGQVLRGVTDPQLSGAVGAPKPQVLLVVQNDGKTAAKARIGFIRGDVMGDVILTGPIGGGTLLNTAGLPTGVSGLVRVQYVRWDLTPRGRAALTPMRARAAAAGSQNRRGRLRILEEAITPSLRDGDVETTTPVFLSAAYELGSQKYRFVDATSLEDRSLTRSSNTFKAAIGTLLATGTRSADNPGTYVGFAYERFRRFKVGAERNLCRPFGEGFECDKFRVGSPALQTGNAISIESRLWLLDGNAGLNPRLDYDVLDDLWTFEVAVPFLKLVGDVANPLFPAIPELAGGVTAGWKSGAEGGPYVLFFVGPTFKLPSPK